MKKIQNIIAQLDGLVTLVDKDDTRDAIYLAETLGMYDRAFKMRGVSMWRNLSELEEVVKTGDENYITKMISRLDGVLSDLEEEAKRVADIVGQERAIRIFEKLGAEKHNTFGYAKAGYLMLLFDSNRAKELFRKQCETRVYTDACLENVWIYWNAGILEDAIEEDLMRELGHGDNYVSCDILRQMEREDLAEMIDDANSLIDRGMQKDTHPIIGKVLEKIGRYDSAKHYLERSYE